MSKLSARQKREKWAQRADALRDESVPRKWTWEQAIKNSERAIDRHVRRMITLSLKRTDWANVLCFRQYKELRRQHMNLLHDYALWQGRPPAPSPLIST